MGLIVMAGTAGAADYVWIHSPEPDAIFLYSMVDAEDTGYRIRLNRKKESHPYTMVDPDGRESACYGLASCKSDAQYKAKERAEFRLLVDGWQIVDVCDEMVESEP